MLKSSARVCWISIAFITIALAYVVSVARLFFPLIEQYRSVVETWASEELNRPVKVTEITADWAGFQPRLRIKKVIIRSRDNRRNWMSLDEVQIYFRPIQSVQNWRPVPGKVNVVGPEVEIDYRNGFYYIGGQKIDSKQRIGQSRLVNWLIRREKLIVSGGRVKLNDPRISHETLNLRKIDLLLSFLPNDYHFSGRFRLKRQIESRFYFMLGLKGSFLDIENMMAKVYFSGSVQLGQWLNKKLLANTDIREGIADFRLWANGKGKLSQVVGDVDLEDVKWTRETLTRQGNQWVKTLRPFEVEKFKANFNYKRDKSGWFLDVKDLVWINKGQSWPNSRLFLKFDDGVDQTRLSGSVRFFRLEDVNQLVLSLLPADSQARTQFKNVDPKGDIRKLVFQLKQDKGQKRQRDFYFSFDFDRLSVNPMGRFPGVQSFRGSIAANRLGGYVQLNTVDAGLTLSGLFGHTLPIKALSGDVIWKRTDKGMLVTSNSLQALSEDAKFKSRFLYAYNQSKSDFLDLNVEFSKGNQSKIETFLPRHVMKPKLVRWLTQALNGGTIRNGEMIYKGNIDDFPFKPGSGQFHVSFNYDDLQFKFHKDWPAINRLNAQLRFDAHGLEAQLYRGDIADLELLPTHVRLTSYKELILELDGAMMGPTNDLINFIGQMPVRNQKNGFLKQFGATGQSLTTLKLRLPLHNIDQRQYSGMVQLFDSKLSHSIWHLQLTELNGFLSYKNQGPLLFLHSSQLKGRYQDRPVGLTIQTKRDNKIANMFINMQADMDFGLLAGGYGEAFAKLFEGEGRWQTGFYVTQFEKRPPRVLYYLNSDLKGVKVKLPGMFNKPAQSSRVLKVSAEISQNQVDAIAIRYGKLMQAKLGIARKRNKVIVNRGEVVLGGGHANLSRQKGIHVLGSLPKLSVSEWTDWLETKKTVQGGSQNVLDNVSLLNLSFTELEVLGNKIHHVKLKARRIAKYWQATVDGHEMEGQMWIPLGVSKNNPLVVSLKRLSMVEQETNEHRHVPDPRNLPPLRIQSNEFYYNGVNHGRLNIVASKSADGLKFNSVTIESKHLNFNAHGEWSYVDGLHRSIFTIKASSNNVGKALQARDYGVNIDRGTASLNISAHWKGPPNWFELKRVNGTMNVDIRNGRILDIKVGGGRLLGMFSLQALPRRLALDFRDVFRKGFSFDRISGRFDISKGDAFTNNLTLDSPAAKVEIAGRIGLADQDYDQVVYVTPKVSSNLAVVGGLAGGPQVGIGLWVADKILGRKINKSITKRYTIEGTWSKPVVRKMKREKTRFNKRQRSTESNDDNS